MSEYKRVKRRKCTFIIVSHNLSSLANCSIIMIMKNHFNQFKLKLNAITRKRLNKIEHERKFHFFKCQVKRTHNTHKKIYNNINRNRSKCSIKKNNNKKWT